MVRIRSVFRKLKSLCLDNAIAIKERVKYHVHGCALLMSSNIAIREIAAMKPVVKFLLGINNERKHVPISKTRMVLCGRGSVQFSPNKGTIGKSRLLVQRGILRNRVKMNPTEITR